MIDQDVSELRALDQRDVQVWNLSWAEVERRIGSLFARSDAHRRAMTQLRGLLSPAARKHSWQLAEISGDPHPYGFQHLLGRADGDPDALRDRLRSQVTDYLAAPDAVGVLDETGLLKTGRHSAGVARQSSGTAGRVEHCHIGGFLAYASDHGQTLLDRELQLPKAWTTDRERWRRAGIPDDRSFATKPALARQLLARAFAAGVVRAWVTGASGSGDDRALRQWLEERTQAYVLAVSGNEPVWINHEQRQIKLMVADRPRAGWERRSAGAGGYPLGAGPRWYDWRRVEVSDPPQAGWKRWLLVRRSMSDPREVTGSIAVAPAQTTLTELVRVAGMRWTVEESIQCAKGEVGLDHYEVRSWTGWYRHMPLALWAHAFWTVVRAAAGAAVAPTKGPPHAGAPSSLAAFKAHRGLQSG